MSKVKIEERHIGETTASIGTLLGRVPQDLRAVVTTQIAVYKIEATRRGQSVGIGVGFFVLAILMFEATLAALLVGLIMLLSSALGTGWAVLIVVVLALVLTAVVARIGLGYVKLATNPDGKS